MANRTHTSYAPRSPDLSAVGISLQDHNDLWGTPSQPYAGGAASASKSEPSDFLPAPGAYPPVSSYPQQQVHSDWFGPTHTSASIVPQPMQNAYNQPQQPQYHQTRQQQMQQQQQHQQQQQYHHQHQMQQRQPTQQSFKVEAQQPPEAHKPYPGELEGTQIKTKFPVARIKRIVQADEDVGKVAQVTPVVVSKALELFMTSLALNSANVAKARGSKRVTAAHLKLAVAQDDQFDFLQDIVDKIPDPPAAASGSARAGAADGDKKPRAKPRKKKDDSDDLDDADDDDDDDNDAMEGNSERLRRKRKPRGTRKKHKMDESD